MVWAATDMTSEPIEAIDSVAGRAPGIPDLGPDTT